MENERKALEDFFITVEEGSERSSEAMQQFSGASKRTAIEIVEAFRDIATSAEGDAVESIQKIREAFDNLGEFDTHALESAFALIEDEGEETAEALRESFVESLRKLSDEDFREFKDRAVRELKDLGGIVTGKLP